MPNDDDTLPLPPTPAHDNRPHVYVINGDQDFLEMMHDLLSDVRVHVTVELMRPNVEVTLANLRSARPDLLIVDVTPYPDSARHLLDALAATDDLRHLPVMLASTNLKLAEQVADDHADFVRDVLPKPFDVEDFYLKLHRLMGITMP
jgi:CheY-like chemotaxis protein